jgi:hypothetical protein
MKALFYTRDVRGGQGERDTFKKIIKQLAFTHPDVLAKNINLIPFYGRYDDLLVLLDTPLEKLTMTIIRAQLLADIDSEQPSLLAKWLPSENASSRETQRLAKKVANNLGLTAKQYRKTLSTLRGRIKLVETQMSEKKFGEIEYDKLPSKAGMIYRKAFYRNDEERYTDFVNSLVKSIENNDKEVKINVKTLFPYEIVGKFPITMTTANNHRHYNAVVGHASANDEKLLDAMWKSLPDYIGDNFDNALAIVDTSGSMRGNPIQVALSLGLYLAERNKGTFANHFITFSRNPELQEVVGDTLGDKLRNMSKADWDSNTDLESVFHLILNTAIKNVVPQDEMPSKLFIISDMQFDGAVRSGNNKTLFEKMREKFADYGYKLPEIVFWNVNAVNPNFPVKVNETGTALVSGCSPSIFKNLLAGKDMTPYGMMLDVLESERYATVIV